MAKIMNLSIKRLPAVNGAIGIQTLADGKQGDATYDYDDNGYLVISVDDKPAVVVNGDLDSNGVMQIREV